MPDQSLYVFLKVAEKLSFTKAAEALYLTQPAVTKRIRVLEDEMGVRLFIRKGSSIELTEEGDTVRKYALKIAELHREMETELALKKEVLRGELTIGASTTIAQYVLPPLLASYQKFNPHLKITLLNGNSESIEAKLKSGLIRLGMVESCSQQAGLKYEPILKDELVAITHHSGKYAKLDSLGIEGLKRLPVILRERGSGTLEVFEDYLKNKNCKLSDLNVIIQLGSTESIKLFLKNAEALGIVSIRAVNEELLRGEFKLIELEEGDVNRWFHVVTPEGSNDKIVSHFVRFAISFITKSYS